MSSSQSVPLSPSTWPTWIGIGFLCLLRFMPRAVRNGLANTMARLSLRRNTGTNRAMRINLEACFPKLDVTIRESILQRSLALHLQALMMLPRNWWGSEQTIIDKGRLHNRHFLDDALATERPVVLLITHSAGLDAGLLAVAPFYNLQGIYNPFGNPVIDYLVFRGRHRFGAKPLPRGSGLRQLINGLKDGKLMCYLSDEDHGKDLSVFAPFFQHQKATLAVLPRLVKKTNALVVPMIAHHDSDNDSVDVHFFEPLQNYPIGDAIADATVMNEAIEHTIRLQPAQFTWKLRLFRTCPNAGRTRYGQIERGELRIEDL